jgi:hypothetical protein
LPFALGPYEEPVSDVPAVVVALVVPDVPVDDGGVADVVGSVAVVGGVAADEGSEVVVAVPAADVAPGELDVLLIWLALDAGDASVSTNSLSTPVPIPNAPPRPSECALR